MKAIKRSVDIRSKRMFKVTPKKEKKIPKKYLNVIRKLIHWKQEDIYKSVMTSVLCKMLYGEGNCHCNKKDCVNTEESK